ncbi:hypothetical protein H5410_015659 [Solanum commersonii]|uniref:Uncharacterized protein n=1 Tax=Solanum commersonii TaxID=4109 RepID=A0A9J5ZUR7_SOLCO|nr:hypothetical protein H5410_015659 [Solanum commersonii]
MARRISNHEEEEQNQMILDYLEERASEDMHEAQQIEEEEPARYTLKKAKHYGKTKRQSLLDKKKDKHY